MDKQNTPKTPRVNITTIPQARCRNHIDGLGLNYKIEHEIAELKASLTEKSTDQEKIAVNTAVDKLVNQKIRINKQAPYAIASVLDKVIGHYIVFAMESAAKQKNRILQKSHLHADGASKLPYSSLFSQLPSYKKEQAKIESELAKEEISKAVDSSLKPFKKGLGELKTKLASFTPATTASASTDKQADVKKQSQRTAFDKAIQDIVTPLFKKVETLQNKTNVVATPMAVEEAADEVVGLDDQEEGRNFVHYIALLKNQLSVTENQKSIKVSKEFKEYLSDLAIEFLAALTKQLQLAIAVLKTKTVSETIVMYVVRMMMVDDLYFEVDFKSGERVIQYAKPYSELDAHVADTLSKLPKNEPAAEQVAQK